MILGIIPLISLRFSKKPATRAPEPVDPPFEERMQQAACKPFVEYGELLCQCDGVSAMLELLAPKNIGIVSDEAMNAVTKLLVSHAWTVKGCGERFEDFAYVKNQLIPARRMLKFALERYDRTYAFALSGKDSGMLARAYMQLEPDFEGFKERLYRRAMVVKEAIAAQP